MDLGLKNKVAMISGASKGIGKAIAGVFASEGANLSICARDEDLLLKTTCELQQDMEIKVLPVVADLTHLDDVKKFVSTTVDKFGLVDVLVNNAGSAPAGEFLKIKDEEWITAWTLKFLGYVRLSREVFPHMRSRKYGCIINIIGNAGKQPMKNYMAGGHINAALLNFTKMLAGEGEQYGIRVNGISPGPTKTERWDDLVLKMSEAVGKNPVEWEKEFMMTFPLRRLAEPDEIANLAAFIASDKACYIHGTVITIDGGLTKCI